MYMGQSSSRITAFSLVHTTSFVNRRSLERIFAGSSNTIKFHQTIDTLAATSFTSHLSASLQKFRMMSIVILVVTWLGGLAVGSSKLIPQAKLCYSYANTNTNHATCGKLVCPYGCSWPFVTAENCMPTTGPTVGVNATSQICHLGYWKESNQVSSCITKFGSYKCSGGSTGFASCTGCRSA
ncbi:hypothetical protein PGT21_036673 [Puccinia graminis f. sp. tritici]|uniref:Uncharacterized protein n=1 Tax=Puccinia graminis f. sp. tritici TaxID=56615 RepID=A0A5B0Q0C3_PUCGR|nr:hypothetical protein PGT21_036673 [Puccinia graminis f. sp. tritici]KAA1126175.1 hypothetical protein PGTUg99_007098 [Puccinia graminis f. sp. tritici]